MLPAVPPRLERPDTGEQLRGRLDTLPEPAGGVSKRPLSDSPPSAPQPLPLRAYLAPWIRVLSVRDRSPSAQPATAHRALSVLAGVSLLAGMRLLWNSTITDYPPYGAVVVGSYGVIMVLAAAAVAVRTQRALTVVDATVLVVGITLFICSVRTTMVPGHLATANDVGMVMQSGADEILRTGRLYGVNWPLAHSALAPGNSIISPTVLFDGSIVSNYGYPPLGALLAAGITALTGTPAGALLAAALGLIAASVLMFRLLPPQLRPLAAVACFGLSILPHYALSEYPVLVALAFLVVAVANWPTVGSGGKLGLRGVVRACCLGLAVATHQLAWFVAPFLVLGLWLVRRGQSRTLSATALTARYTVIAAVAWLLPNLPFILQSLSAWLGGSLEPLTQQSFPHGQGLIDIVEFFTSGSGNLNWFSYAPLVMEAGLLLAFAFFFNRLGPAATVLPWLVFFVSARSQDGYFLLFTPLWVMGAATLAHPDLYTRGHRLLRGLRRLPAGRWVRVVLAALLPAASLGCVAAAAATPAPLTMQVTELRTTSQGDLWRIRADVTNTSANALDPHFALTSMWNTIGLYWKVLDGPTRLAAHASAHYILVAPETGIKIPSASTAFTLRAFTTAPKTMSSARIAHGHPRAVRAVLLTELSNADLAPGEHVRITVQIRDSVGNDVHRAGIPVRLKAAWIASKSEVGQAVLVNGKPVAETPDAVTGANGQAVFTVTSDTSMTEPVVITPSTSYGGSAGSVTYLWHA